MIPQPTTVGSVDHILRFGYFLMTVTILLMVWCSYARAANREIEQIRYPPCSFNPLCSCSKPAPDLGIVQCRNVPFPSIPNSVNTSKVFMLHMERTGLRELEPYFFQATGNYHCSIDSLALMAELHNSRSLSSGNLVQSVDRHPRRLFYRTRTIALGIDFAAQRTNGNSITSNAPLAKVTSSW